MREITTHKVNWLNEALTINAVDEPGSGGANHEYRIAFKTLRSTVEGVGCETTTYGIKFQNGPIKVAGVNGISNEALIAIVIDRLGGFQTGDFANEDNAQALEYLNSAVECLHRRTKDRIARGVEGTLVA